MLIVSFPVFDFAASNDLVICVSFSIFYISSPNFRPSLQLSISSSFRFHFLIGYSKKFLIVNLKKSL